MQLQLVEVRDNLMSTSQLVLFYINEGKVSGFDVHPSLDYVLITSSTGKIYVFRLDTGELRGTIDAPKHAQGCLIDPSGLYVVVSVPALTTVFPSNGLVPTQVGGCNERDLSHTAIIMFEIVTGFIAAEVQSIFDIKEMKFSTDGRYISLGSNTGAVSVWALNDHVFFNVHSTL